MLDTDTIVAIATPPGRGGLGVVRVSGPAALACVGGVLGLRAPLVARVATLVRVLAADGAVLDEAIATWFAAPNSYTGEDVVEVSAHGAPVLLRHLLQACVAGGARLAEPGEFTQRAYLNGRLDLAEAEAVNDLIGAHTLAQARVAAAQLGGALARAVAPVKAGLLQLIAGLEVGVDFAEDDVEVMSSGELVSRADGLRAGLAPLLAGFDYGRLLREGFTLALVGRPNAGKSSLFNRLLGHERAIVTAQAGTTRDPIEAGLELGGVPVSLVDTAGLREDADGEAERIGMVRSRERAAEADLVLEVLDASVVADSGVLHPTHRDTTAMNGAPSVLSPDGSRVLRVWNKCDLGAAPAGELGVSALTGAGVAELQAAILERLGGGARAAADTAVVTNLRQQGALTEASDALGRAAAAAAKGIPQDVLLVDLYAALEALDALTGASGSEAVLRLIFSQFCIGK